MDISQTYAHIGDNIVDIVRITFLNYVFVCDLSIFVLALRIFNLRT